MNPKKRVIKEKSVFKPTLPLVMVLANKIINQLGFTQRINEGITADASAWTVDAGRLLKALVLSTFQDMRAPLTHVSERLRGFDIEYLLDKNDIEPDELSAFSIGRALERLGNADPDRIYEAMALEAVLQNKIPINRLHSDTTTVSFYGEYDISKLDLTQDEKDELLKIERGYNKDGRPGCGQAVVGQVVNEMGIPLISRTMDGATSDVEWNRLALTYLNDIINAGFDGIYVADSKLVFEDAIKAMFDKERPIRFVSRVPANFESHLESWYIGWAYLHRAWEDLGTFHEGPQASAYKGQSFTRQLYGNTVRILVLESSSLVYKAQQALQRDAEKAAKELNKLKHKVFENEKDADAELDSFKKKWACFDFGLSITKKAEIKYQRGARRAGVPGKEIITYRLDSQSESWNYDACIKRLHFESCIVLISNVVDGYTDSELLKIYKGQQVVENSFRLLKDPQLASVIFLKNPTRIKGLMMILSFALLIRAIIQFKLRMGLDVFNSENNAIPLRVGWNDRPLEIPTFKLLYEHAYNCRYIRENSDTYNFFCFDDKTEKRVTTLLLLMGYSVDNLLD